jgi:hypothetical protein
MSNEEYKLPFMLQVTKEYFARVESQMNRAIIKTKSIETGQLKDSVDSTTTQQSAKVSGSLLFAPQGRFLDMGVGRGHGRSSRIQHLQNAIIGSGGTKRTAPKTRKARAVYAKIAYGNLNGLMGDLLYGFTEETINTIKNNIQP